MLDMISCYISKKLCNRNSSCFEFLTFVIKVRKFSEKYGLVKIQLIRFIRKMILKGLFITHKMLQTNAT